MTFWYYAFWYLFIGVILDVGLCRKTRPALWSIFLWPVITAGCIVVAIAAWFKDDDSPRRYE